MSENTTDECTCDYSDVVAGQGDVADCGCGWPITEYDGEWLHIFNPALTGTDDHDARPSR